MRHFRIRARSSSEFFDNHHRFEHWYRNNTVYFITARCREGYPAFSSEPAKAIFWNRFDHYAQTYGFVPWVTTLLSNHYHTLGYLKLGENLGPMMQRLHGSVAKLVNDLQPLRRRPFWREAGRHDYFDGCLRNEQQCRRAYRYTLVQSVRHGVCKDYHHYPHTRINVDLDRGIKRALELHTFMEDVPYQRYEHNKNRLRT